MIRILRVVAIVLGLARRVYGIGRGHPAICNQAGAWCEESLLRDNTCYLRYDSTRRG